MHHYLAFLRGMNLGNRRISMDQLRGHFADLGFADVATFIASGNVIFSSKVGDSRKLEKQIERHLADRLGYEVDTFVRTRAEIAEVAKFRPPPTRDRDDAAVTIHAGFLREQPDPALVRALVSCQTAVDEFHVKGREYYWCCRIRTSESKVWSLPTMKALRLPTSTMRNMNTVRKLAVLFPASPE